MNRLTVQIYFNVHIALFAAARTAIAFGCADSNGDLDNLDSGVLDTGKVGGKWG